MLQPAHPDLTLPGIFDGPSDRLPYRHRPVRRSHGDVWRTACGSIAWDFAARRFVLENCQPCPACATASIAEHAGRAVTAVLAAVDLRGSDDPDANRAADTLTAVAMLEARDAEQETG